MATGAVLIVGGTRGLGRHLAERYARSGRDVLITGRDHQQAKSIAGEIGGSTTGLALELSEPEGVLGPLARFHVHTVVPALGALLSGAPEYHYLQSSIARFPRPDEFVALLERAGITSLSAKPLTFGVCHVFVGTPRPPS